MIQCTFDELKDFCGALAYVSEFTNKYGMDVIIHHGLPENKNALVTFVKDGRFADCEISFGNDGDYISTGDVLSITDSVGEILKEM